MDRFTLLTEPQPIIAVEGTIYSTSPTEGMTAEAGPVVLKGPGIRIVFAEAAGFALSKELGLPVPPFGSCLTPDGDLFFCSKKLRGRYAIEHWMEQGLLANSDAIAQTIVFDIWTGNYDRNIGNFIADRLHPGSGAASAETYVYAIDFEKAAVLRGEPDQFTVGAWPEDKCWPTDALGLVCNGLPRPDDFVHAVGEMNDDRIRGILETVVADLDLPDVTWLDGCCAQLGSRRDRLDDLSRRAWHE